jgi:ribosomal protein S6--L-glutamate ligase
VRFLILSRGRSVHSTNRLVEEARAAGHDVRVVDPAACLVGCGRTGAVLSSTGRPLAEGVDVVIPRVGSRTGDGALAVLAALESTGVACMDGAAPIERAGDKFRSLQALADSGVRVPQTVLVRSTGQLAAAVRLVGGPPAVLKLRRGTGGVGVVLGESLETLESVGQTLLALGESVVVQERVGRSGLDLRAVVVNGRVVAAMERRATGGEFRANVRRGARVRGVQPEGAIARVAAAAATALGLKVCGVDLVVTDDGPRVLEVNAAPGFAGIERATRANVAGAVVACAAEP